MVGMVVALGGLMLVAKSVAPTLSAGAVGFVAFGAAVLIAAAGISLLSLAAINLANAGPLAIWMYGLAWLRQSLCWQLERLLLDQH